MFTFSAAIPSFSEPGEEDAKLLNLGLPKGLRTILTAGILLVRDLTLHVGLLCPWQCGAECGAVQRQQEQASHVCNRPTTRDLPIIGYLTTCFSILIIFTAKWNPQCHRGLRVEVAFSDVHPTPNLRHLITKGGEVERLKILKPPTDVIVTRPSNANTHPSHQVFCEIRSFVCYGCKLRQTPWSSLDYPFSSCHSCCHLGQAQLKSLHNTVSFTPQYFKLVSFQLTTNTYSNKVFWILLHALLAQLYHLTFLIHLYFELQVFGIPIHTSLFPPHL